MRIGGFMLRAFASQEIGYDDNVFSNLDKRDSFVYTTSGGGTAASDWKRHQVYASGYAAYLGVTEFPQEDAWVGNASTGGYVDLTRDIRFGLDAGAARLLDIRGDP